MKVNTMAAESAAGGAILYKLGAALGLGVLGAAVMAAFDPPASKKELFLQASTAGVGSVVFGPLGLELAAKYITVVPAESLQVPGLFLVGALSWGAFGALAKLRQKIRDKGADKVAEKVGL